MAWRVTSSYAPNRGETGVVGIATGPHMVSALSKVGHQAVGIAQTLAPTRTGRYRSSFRVTLGTRGSGRRRRAEVSVTNTAPYAAALEWGNARTSRPARVLGRTQARMRAAGYVS